MNSPISVRRGATATSLYGLFDPLPYGLFVGALIFDAIYANTAVMLWNKGAAWLITIGLLFAIIPRVIQLVWVCTRSQRSDKADVLDFSFNLVAIIAATANAFVHSRDAYGVMPTGLWLSIATVAFIAAARLTMSIHMARTQGA